MLKLILVRHGETERNSQQRLQGGKSDTPLNRKGKEQAQRVGDALKAEQLDAVYCSPLKRAVDTALEIAVHHRLAPQPLPGLAELDMGLIDGSNLSEIKESQLDFWKRWQTGDYSVALPGGESLSQVRQRAWLEVREVAGRHPEGTVVLVSHSITLQTVITAALRAPLECFPHLSIGVASISILRMNGDRASLVTLNDTCHLTEMK